MTRENGRVPAAIMRLMVIASAVLLGLSASAAIATADADAAKRKQPKPNVVLIMSDDQRADAMRWMPKTRRLLGEAGTTFTRFLAPFPLCCPARMSVMAGQYPHNHGVLNNQLPFGYAAMDFSRTIYTALDDDGCRCGQDTDVGSAGRTSQSR